MNLNKDHIGGLVFLMVSVVYGYFAYEIRMFPGDQIEPFNAQTLPRALAWVGAVLSIAMLVNAHSADSGRLSFAGLEWRLVLQLMLLVWLFAQALEWVGFLLATMLFLIAGYWLLGERQLKTLVLASVPFAIAFWFLLSHMLDIYLAPGRLWHFILG